MKVLVIVNIWACVMTEMVKTHQTQSSDQSRSSLLIGCFIRSNAGMDSDRRFVLALRALMLLWCLRGFLSYLINTF